MSEHISVNGVSDKGANLIIKIDTKERKIAETFADVRKVNDEAFYKKGRGAFKREDILCGALAEIAAFYYLHDVGVHVDYPDFSVHIKKSYAADLTDGLNLYHVKGQTRESERLYGCSYLCQKRDKLVTQPTLSDILLLCVVDVDANEVEIKGEIKAVDVKWGEAKVEWLRFNKKALYLKDNLKKMY